jgi:long-chain fatty acid transport protein
MTTKMLRSQPVAAAVAAMFALVTGPAFGAAFALQENSGSGLGNAFAGGSAVAEDASTIWANPSGMAKLPALQAAAAIHIITPSNKFRNDGSIAASFQPLGGDGGDAGSTNFVPNLYVNVPINPQWNFGLGVNAPFGLKTEYDNGWLGRFHGIKSEIKTINVNPALSWKIVPTFAVGVGVDWQRIDATLTNNVNYSAGLAQAAATAAAQGLIPAGLVPTIISNTSGLESFADIDADDDAWGWNIGALWDVTPNTRIGAHYRSSIKYKVSGNVSFDNPALPTLPPTLAPAVQNLANAVNAQLANGGITADIELPDIANLSFFSRLNDRWDIMGDVQYTRWSTIKDLTIVRTTGTLLQSTPLNFDDVWRFSVGANYRYDDKWMFRTGIAYDETPVNQADRIVRLPDESRFWLALGAQYKWNNNLKLDGGFVYIWVDNASINQGAGSLTPIGYPSGLVKGNYDSFVTIFSAQLTYTF